MPVKSSYNMISSGGYYGAENMLLNLATSQERPAAAIIFCCFTTCTSPTWNSTNGRSEAKTEM